MRLAYITAQFPWSKGESFFLSEVRELLRRGTELVIFPIHPARSVPADRVDLRPYSIALPMLSDAVMPGALRSARGALGGSVANWFRVTGHGTPMARLKNCVSYPKALWIAEQIRQHRIDHIHALWASTSATAAMIASDLTGIPFSFSAHRGDLESPNILRIKAQRACFIRCISEDGRRHALSLAGQEFAGKAIVTHLGVNIPEENVYAPAVGRTPVGLCPAALIPRKGQIYLLGALRTLLQRGSRLQIWFAGRGKDERRLKRLAADLIERDTVRFLGHLSHDELLNLYRRREIAFVVLPSLHEGIPVALMEAMAHGVPAISTDVGGTAELLRGGAGILVPSKDEPELAAAMQEVLDREDTRATLSRLGYRRVRDEFNIVQTTAELEQLCRRYSATPNRLAGSAVA